MQVDFSKDLKPCKMIIPCSSEAVGEFRYYKCLKSYDVVQGFR